MLLKANLCLLPSAIITIPWSRLHDCITVPHSTWPAGRAPTSRWKHRVRYRSPSIMYKSARGSHSHSTLHRRWPLSEPCVALYSEPLASHLQPMPKKNTNIILNLSCTQGPVMLAPSSYSSLPVSCGPRSRQADHKPTCISLTPASQQPASQQKPSQVCPCTACTATRYLSKMCTTHSAGGHLRIIHSSPCKSARSSVTTHLSLLKLMCMCNVRASERQVDTTVSQSLLQAEGRHETWAVDHYRCT
jgi:hypothetical protein